MADTHKQAEASELLPLPAHYSAAAMMGFDGLFTADQMHSYAIANLAAAQPVAQAGMVMVPKLLDAEMSGELWRALSGSHSHEVLQYAWTRTIAAAPAIQGQPQAEQEGG